MVASLLTLSVICRRMPKFGVATLPRHLARKTSPQPVARIVIRYMMKTMLQGLCI